MVLLNPLPFLVVSVTTRTFGSPGIDHDETLRYSLVNQRTVPGRSAHKLVLMSSRASTIDFYRPTLSLMKPSSLGKKMGDLACIDLAHFGVVLSAVPRGQAAGTE